MTIQADQRSPERGERAASWASARVKRRLPAPGGAHRGRATVHISRWRAVRRLFVYLLLTLALLPVQIVAVAFRTRLANDLPRFYHGLCCRILGFTIEQRGTISAEQPTLFVGNHSSYLDIVIYGAVIRGSFVAKAEVAGWPLFGLLAKLQRTVFIDRRRGSTRAQSDEISRRLDAGDNLILFPEGTSDDGNHVLPFRSALLGVAERGVRTASGETHPLTVQPMTIAYVRLNGFPIGHALRPFFAWYGDMQMAQHLWLALGLGTVTVSVEFHPVVTIADFASRKALTEHCREVVQGGLSAALSGRPVGQQPAPPRPVSPEGEPAKPVHFAAP